MDYNDLMYDFSIVIFLHFRFKLLLISLHTIYKKESILSLYNSAKFLQPKSKSPLPSSNFIYTPFLNILYIIDKNMFSYPSIPFSCINAHHYIHYQRLFSSSIFYIQSSTSASYSGYFFWIS